MVTLRGRAAAIGAACLLAVSCSSSGDAGTTGPDGCGVPDADPNASVGTIPQELLIDGVEVISVTLREDGFDAVMTIDRDVSAAFGAFRDALADGDFSVIGEDNEGFEAEIYLSERKGNASLQVRRTTCEDLSIVFFRVVEAPKS